MVGHLVTRSVCLICFARFRPNIDRFCCQAIDGLHVGLAGLSKPNLAEVENRNLEIDLNSAASAACAAGFALRSRNAGNFEQVDEPGCSRQAV